MQCGQHLRFALGAIGGLTAFQRADRLRMARAFVQPLQDLAIERVDGRAVARQVLAGLRRFVVGHRA